eukprot:CAMPEP_0170361032 /NCGR_PEP_ID=MMETSP0117_2-20130122/3593_1 /TAXON_ID=400756 /ORGANISM="Durinskia baltica, Strain CSIRO CS-38" /LENGTH=375 /DNA_ID=CAMNT_0010615377 /DNA_START=213 /DNA_END=1340 /DNA_ORIENTATION=+
MGAHDPKKDQPQKLDAETNSWGEDEFEPVDREFSNVSLSSDSGDERGASAPVQKEGFLGQIKSTTMSAGSAVISKTEYAGTAFVGGLKATTQLLNPLNIGRQKSAEEEQVDQRKVDEDFANIQIEDEPEEQAPQVKPKPIGFFDSLKAKTGLAGNNHDDSTPPPPPVRAASPHSPSSYSQAKHVPQFPHHQTHGDYHGCHGETYHNTPPPSAQTIAQKESFLNQIKNRVGLGGKEAERENESSKVGMNADDPVGTPPGPTKPAPKEGLLSNLNPFSKETSSRRTPPPTGPATTPSNATTSSSKRNSTSSGGISGMFDSLTGKSEAPKKEPPKQASFIDHLTGKSQQPPKKEPSFFDSITGNSTPAKSKSSSTDFW